MTPANSTTISTATKVAARSPQSWCSARSPLRASCVTIPTGSRQGADRALQQGPGLVAVFRLPFGVEFCLLQRGTEFRLVHLDENQPLGFQIGGHAVVQPGDVGPLIQRRAVEFL